MRRLRRAVAFCYSIVIMPNSAHGLGRRAMAVYERAALAADDERAFGAWRLYAAKVERAYGAPKARGVYERAVKALNVDDDAKKMCLAFASLERGLGEVDRARAILAHGAQFATGWTATLADVARLRGAARQRGPLGRWRVKRRWKRLGVPQFMWRTGYSKRTRHVRRRGRAKDGRRPARLEEA